MFIFFPRNRKGLLFLLSVGLIAFVIISISTFVSWVQDQKQLQEKGQPDFNKLSIGQLEHGLIVKGTIDLVFDTYAEQYETSAGERTSEKSENLYYILPIYDLDENSRVNIKYFITYKAKPDEFAILDKILEETWSESSGQSVLNIPNGQILNLESDVKKYLEEWVNDTDLYEGGSFINWCAENNIFNTNDKEAIKSRIVPYMLIKTETAGTNIQLIWIYGGVAIIFLIFLLVLISSGRPAITKKEINPYQNKWEE